MAGSERDPDDFRDGAILDDVPGTHWARVRGLRYAAGVQQQTEAQAEIELRDLRRRAERLSEALRQLDPASPPPTIPDSEPEALRAHCSMLEGRIKELRAKAEPNPSNGWLGHAPARRPRSSLLYCSTCLASLEPGRTRGPCADRPGRY